MFHIQYFNPSRNLTGKYSQTFLKYLAQKHSFQQSDLCPGSYWVINSVASNKSMQNIVREKTRKGNENEIVTLPSFHKLKVNTKKINFFSLMYSKLTVKALERRQLQLFKFLLSQL